MKSRWLIRTLGGMSALILGVLVSLALAQTGLLNGTTSHVYAGDGCPAGMHVCADNTHCCPATAAYDCVVNSCDASKSRRCYTATDENLKYLSQCCSQLIRCP
jgi:hypothetical protein